MYSQSSHGKDFSPLDVILSERPKVSVLRLEFLFLLERVFDLSRSISLHKISSAHTNKEAIGGITSGLINKNETVTWRAKHLFKIRYFIKIY